MNHLFHDQINATFESTNVNCLKRDYLFYLFECKFINFIFSIIIYLFNFNHIVIYNYLYVTEGAFVTYFPAFVHLN